MESVQRVWVWAAELDAPGEPHAVDGLALAVEGARRADDSARGVDAEALPIAAAYATGVQEAVAHGAILALVPVHREDLVHEEAGLTLLRVGGTDGAGSSQWWSGEGDKRHNRGPKRNP